jgi:cellobiose PTS system EIIB component
MKQITLICAGGMSTSMLVSKMKTAAAQQGVEVEIRATAEASFPEFEGKTDVLLLGPQVGYKLNSMKLKYAGKDMKIAVINSVDYGMMNGEKVLKTALSM